MIESTQLENKSQSELLDKLRHELRLTYGKPINSVKDFQGLAERVSLSVQTLRRFFGKIDAGKLISISSRNVICRYAGYKDWDEFCEISQKDTECDDKNFIDGIFPFYDNMHSYDISLFSKGLFDVNENYARSILQNAKNLKYFISRYQNKPAVLEEVFPMFPNYSILGKDFYRREMKRVINVMTTPHRISSVAAFQALGCFLTKDYSEAEKFLQISEKQMKAVRSEFDFFSFPETRLCIAKIFHLKVQGKPNEMISVLEDFLRRNEMCNCDNPYIFDRNIFYIYTANALVWMQEPQLAWEILRNFDIDKEFLQSIFHVSKKVKSNINSRLIFQTLLMVRLLNEKNTDELIRLKENFEKNDFDDWLFQDFFKIQSLLISLKKLPSSEIAKRMEVKKDLRYLAEKTELKAVEDLTSFFE